jgi:1,5-anhydro-D-fructose reductase (1,5-anhydro-D-mannitol-forming)
VRLRWGLIGASSWAAEWMIDAFRAVEGGAVTAVLSASAERGARFAQDHGIPGAAASLDELLGDPDVNAVYVSTTNDLHAEQVLAAAAAGKHVLCEKPIATTVQDARRMVAACREAGVVLGVNHHLRSQDTVRTMRSLVASGEIGDVLSARCAHLVSLPPQRRTWRTTRPEAGAGAVLDLTVHDVDTLRFLLADEIDTVSALTVTQGVAASGIEDTVVGAMRTRGGVPVTFHDAFTHAHSGTALEVHGTTGTLVGQDLFGPEPSGTVTLRRGAVVRSVPIPERRNAYERTVERFAAAAGGDGRPAADGADGFASTATAIAVLASAAEGRAVAVEHL